MSTSIIPANIKVPAHVLARMQQPSVLSESVAGGLGIGDMPPRISIKGARFRIIEGTDEIVLDETKLRAIIVGANPAVTKTYFAKAWNPNDEPAAPDCQSLDGIRPDPAIADPQNDICATCPQNAWGSKVNDSGQQLKACADQKRLAIVAADDPGGTIYLLQVTPAALRGLSQYRKELTARGIPLEVVETVLSFDTTASFPKLKFQFGGFLDEETQAIVDGLFGSDEVKAVTGELPPEPVAEPVQTKAKAKKAPLRVVEEVEDEEEVEEAEEVEEVEEAEEDEQVEEEEKPKRGFGKAATAKAKPSAAAPKAAPAKTKAGGTKAGAAKAPAKAVAADADSDALADEIAALLEGMDDD